MHRHLLVYTWLSGCSGRDGTRPSQNATLAQCLRSREGRAPSRPGFATASTENCRAHNERGGSSLEHEPPPQYCYRMLAFTSSRTCSACQRLERQQNRSHICICCHLVREFDTKKQNDWRKGMNQNAESGMPD